MMKLLKNSTPRKCLDMNPPPCPPKGPLNPCSNYPPNKKGKKKKGTFVHMAKTKTCVPQLFNLKPRRRINQATSRQPFDMSPEIQSLLRAARLALLLLVGGLATAETDVAQKVLGMCFALFWFFSFLVGCRLVWVLMFSWAFSGRSVLV